MSVSFIFGKPGGGKSLYSLREVITELTTGTRPVITNLPIRPDKLNEYLQSQGHSVDLHRRLRLIDEEQLGQWFRYRGRMPDNADGSPGDWVTLPPTDEATGKTNFGPSPGPVFYALDEIHTKFNARLWMKTGLGAIFYLSQHRKLGDDVLMISQTPAQVDKQLRSMSQEWVHLTNMKKLRFLFIFTLPSRLLWRSYAGQPGPGEPILATGMLKIASPGMADCYDTASGNGIAGRGNADIGSRKKGVPWYALALLPLVFVGLFQGFDYSVKAALRGPVREPVVVSNNQGTAPAKPPEEGEARGLAHLVVPPPQDNSQAPAPRVPPVSDKRIAGWATIGRELFVYIEGNASPFTTRNGLESFDAARGMAIIRGVAYFL